MAHGFRYGPGQIVPGTGLKVIRPLGSGGMGAVYEVEKISLGAPFVMKVLHPHLMLSGAQAARRMDQEARTQARLVHRNIVRVYDAGVTAEVPGLPYYVMDKLDGYTLRQVLRWHRARKLSLPLSWAFWISASVLSALEHAHKNGVIHRDVKPANIFVHEAEGHTPIVKLLDFGIMGVISSAESHRLTQGFTGTPTHASPEQIRGDAATPAMDVYATGVVLFELLTGRLPFDDRKGTEAMIRAHLTELPPPVSRWRDVHPKLDSLVLCMLAKDPTKRPARARDALNDLGRVKSEWMRESSETFGSDSVEFKFDIGDRWSTNMDNIAFTASDEGATPATPARAGLAELGGVNPLGFHGASDPGGSMVSTRDSWGRTLDRARSHPRRRSALLIGSATCLAAASMVGWKVVMTHDGGSSASVTPVVNSSPPSVEHSSFSAPASATPVSAAPLAVLNGPSTDAGQMHGEPERPGSLPGIQPTRRLISPAVAKSRAPSHASPFDLSPSTSRGLDPMSPE